MSRIHACLKKQTLSQKHNIQAIYCKQENCIFFACKTQKDEVMNEVMKVFGIFRTLNNHDNSIS
jgi:hypothetical protein